MTSTKLRLLHILYEIGTNKTISTDNTLSLKVLSFSSQIPGYEKIKVSARKIETSPEKIDDARIWGGLQPPSPPGSYAYRKMSHISSKTVNMNLTPATCWAYFEPS